MEAVVKNHWGEKLQVVVGGDEQSRRVVIFVHGFGVDLHETGELFDYEAEQLGDRFLTMQFSLSGCGKSEGKSEEMNYQKHAGDLGAVIDWVRHSYPSKSISLLTHSMGGFVTLLLSPEGIEKTIMVGLPNYDIGVIRDRILKRFAARQGAVLNIDGVSILPRSSGLMQKIGPSFWRELGKIEPLSLLERYATRAKIKIIHMRNDEILGRDFIDDYHQLAGVESAWIDGDHSVTQSHYRQQLMVEINSFL